MSKSFHAGRCAAGILAGAALGFGRGVEHSPAQRCSWVSHATNALGQRVPPGTPGRV